jgi:hypothetical protein
MPAGRPLDRLVDRVDVKIDELFRIATRRLHLLARGRIAEHREREPRRAAHSGSRRAQDPRSRPGRPSEIGEELARVLVHPGLGPLRKR